MSDSIGQAVRKRSSSDYSVFSNSYETEGSVQEIKRTQSTPFQELLMRHTTGDSCFFGKEMKRYRPATESDSSIHYSTIDCLHGFLLRANRGEWRVLLLTYPLLQEQQQRLRRRSAWDDDDDVPRDTGESIAWIRVHVGWLHARHVALSPDHIIHRGVTDLTPTRRFTCRRRRSRRGRKGEREPVGGRNMATP